MNPRIIHSPYASALPWLCLVWPFLIPPATIHAAELQVGPGQAFARIEDALAKARAGDLILVHPARDGQAYERVALYVKTPRLTIRAAQGAGRIALRGDGFEYSGRGSTPRAIVQFNRGADGCTLEGFELSGAHNQSHNGAGVRINQANDVTIRDCDIHDNDMGIMSNGDGTQKSAVNQLIERCRIHHNGSEKEPGYNHNLYLGGTSVKIVGCEVSDSITGHNIKSRAHVTVVMACYVHDSANREFDLVDAADTAVPGSDAAIVGCVIVKAKGMAGNRGVIHFGQDGKRQHDGTIWLANNTILTPYVSPVLTLSASRSRSMWLNNIVCDPTGKQRHQMLISAKDVEGEAARGDHNALSAGFGDEGLRDTLRLTAGPAAMLFVDQAKGDYRLRTPLPEQGHALPDELRELMGTGLLEYVAPLKVKVREDADKPALGAHP